MVIDLSYFSFPLVCHFDDHVLETKFDQCFTWFVALRGLFFLSPGCVCQTICFNSLRNSILIFFLKFACFGPRRFMVAMFGSFSKVNVGI